MDLAALINVGIHRGTKAVAFVQLKLKDQKSQETRMEETHRLPFCCADPLVTGTVLCEAE